MIDDFLKLIGVACPHVEKRHAMLLHDRQGRSRQRRACIAEQGEHPALLDEFAGVGLGARHLVGIVEGDELDPAAMHPAGLVHFPEVGEGAVADVVAELGVDAGKGCRLPDYSGRDTRARGRSGTAGQVRIDFRQGRLWRRSWTIRAHPKEPHHAV
jgi:hypothetical protein